MNAKVIIHKSDHVADYVEYLQDAKLLVGIRDDPEAMQYFCSYLKVKRYKVGSSIISEGARDGCMYFLLEGTVEVYKTSGEGDRFVVAKFDAKGCPFFGEGAILHDLQRSSTIVTATNVICLVLKREDFDILCRDKPKWGLPIVKHIALILSERVRKQAHDFVQVYNALVEEIRGY